MAFRFSLAPLLRLRLSVEKQCALRLREASMRVIESEEKIERLNSFLRKCDACDEQRTRAGVRAVEMQFAVLVRDQLERMRSELQSELKKHQLARQKATDEYQQAYRHRESLEVVRQRQLRNYQGEELRKEQRRLDDIYLLQRWRNR